MLKCKQPAGQILLRQQEHTAELHHLPRVRTTHSLSFFFSFLFQFVWFQVLNNWYGFANSPLGQLGNNNHSRSSESCRCERWECCRDLDGPVTGGTSHKVRASCTRKVSYVAVFAVNIYHAHLII